MPKKVKIRDYVSVLNEIGVNSSEVGEAIFYSLLINRREKDSFYRYGNIKGFKKFESDYISRGLEQIIFEKESIFKGELKKGFFSSFKTEVNNLNYVYDALIYLNNKGKSENYIFSFLGEALYDAFNKDKLSDNNDLVNNSDYSVFLNEIVRKISEKFHIHF